MIDRLEQLGAMAEIRAIKARYWRAVDSRDTALLRSVFTDVVDVDFQGATGGPADDPALRWSDPDRFVADTMTATTGVQTIHHGFEPEIEILSNVEAKATWPFEDRAWLAAPNAAIPFNSFTGYGYYHDHYRKVDDAWKIERTRIERSRFETS